MTIAEMEATLERLQAERDRVDHADVAFRQAVWRAVSDLCVALDGMPEVVDTKRVPDYLEDMVSDMLGDIRSVLDERISATEIAIASAELAEQRSDYHRGLL